MRPTNLSLCVLLAALSLSASALAPYATPRLPSGMVSAKAPPKVEPHGKFLTHESKLNFLRPLQAVNQPGGVNEPVQVGAWGDEASVGNAGVQVEIQTNSYNMSGQQENAFWVGDVLSDGSFVQFGYLMMPPGYYCLNAHVTATGTGCLSSGDNIGLNDARWFWSYFPNAQAVNDWYYGFGGANSAGSNGTWHLYSIQPSGANDWNFVMDGVTVYASSFASTISTSPVHMVAEKAAGPYLSQLGPTEFRGLAYLGNDSLWHATSSLTPIDGCGAAAMGSCFVSSSYGVEAVGPNDVIAGSGVLVPNATQLVWARQSACTLGTALQTSGTVGDAPLNVTFEDSVSAPQGNTTTDWWFGDGLHMSGESNQTVTYNNPGNYTPVVRVLDAVGCLSEASGNVSVAASVSSTEATSSGTALIGLGVVDQRILMPRNAYAPCD